MPKVFLVLCFLLNLTNNNVYTTRVEKIEYTNLDYKENKLWLKISLNSSLRDIVELKIYFYDINNNKINDDYYSSAIEINGKVDTFAKIPIIIDEKKYLNIVLVSNYFNCEIENVMIPIYPKEESECDLDENEICRSENPSVVTYENKILEEKYESIMLINRETINVFNNILPIDKVSLILKGKLNEGIAYLIVESEMGIENNLIPLSVKQNDELVSFRISGNYYIDFLNGVNYENYKTNTIYDNKIILPYGTKTYKFYIVMEECFKNFKNVNFSFYVNVDNNLIGKCTDSKYCIRRSYV